MALEDLADLIRASNSNLNRKVQELHNETYGQLMSLQSDMTEAKSDISVLRQEFDLAGTVTEMKRKIAALEAEVAALKRTG